GSVSLAESLGSWAEILRLHHRQNRPFAAKLYEEALEALEAQTAHLGGTDDGRSVFRSQHADIWRGYTELLFGQDNPGGALEVIERSRAQSLMEMLVRGRVAIRNGVDRNLLEEMQLLKRSLVVKFDNRVGVLTQSNGTLGQTTADSEIAKIIVRQNEVDAAIQKTSPRYASLAKPKALTIREIQALLDEDTTLIEYMLGDAHTRVWTVTPYSVRAYELPSRMSVEARARDVYSLLSQNRCLESDPEWRRAITNLANILVAPIKKELKGRRLAVVSDGALQYIPFGILPIDDPGTPLIARYEVIALPSASVLSLLRSERARRRPPVNSLAVLADPVFDSSDERVKHDDSKRQKGIPSTMTLTSERLMRSIADARQSDHLPRLIASRREASAILAATPGVRKMAALDFSANRPRAIGGQLAKYRIVHFATHALLDSSHPELSGLVLSLVDPEGNPQNGFLSLEDIYNLNLPVDLVVLSACETALGKQIDGEGLVGLTRGFMYAGATRVVASLWKMDDVASAELMARFYREMGEKQ
ncbi:MAG TPA: CHAT domain-containing protein, partial [Bryobacteraceae bacterium]